MHSTPYFSTACASSPAPSTGALSPGISSTMSALPLTWTLIGCLPWTYSAVARAACSWTCNAPSASAPGRDFNSLAMSASRSTRSDNFSTWLPSMTVFFNTLATRLSTCSAIMISRASRSSDPSAMRSISTS